MPYQIFKIDNSVLELSDASIAQIAASGGELRSMPCRTADEIIEKCQNADALIVVAEVVDARVLDALKTLKVIGRCGVGVEKIDLEAATRRGVQVTNVPDANFHEVATHTIALALALTRRISTFDTSVRTGRWRNIEGLKEMRRTQAQEFGIVGFGRIGERVAQMAIALGFNVSVSTPREEDKQRALALGAKVTSFDELISGSDILTIHVPLNDRTRGVISDDVMARMKQGSYLINVSRGGLVDEKALKGHLNSGHLAGAALDVFSTEPISASDQLLGAKNLVLTPHVAYLSKDSEMEVSAKVVEEVLTVLRGDAPRYPVNTPIEAQPTR